MSSMRWTRASRAAGGLALLEESDLRPAGVGAERRHEADRGRRRALCVLRDELGYAWLMLCACEQVLKLKLYT